MPHENVPPEETRRMLIPQYSLRWLFGLITAAAGVLSIVAVGVRGQAWALAVSIGLLSIVVSALVYAAAFGLVWLFSVVTAGFARRTAETSPFGSPPAALPPEPIVAAEVVDERPGES